MKSNFYRVVMVAVIAGVLAACSGDSQPTGAPSGAPVATDPPTQVAPTQTAVPTPNVQTFTFDPAQTTAHFIIHEVLTGQPNTVDGQTNKVKGQILASYDDPSTASISPIKVDMSALATDNPMRNRTLQTVILQTANPDFQFAEFTMTKLDGLPATITIGQPFDFKIIGNLAMHGVTKEVTFDATVTPASETKLQGKASVEVQYADWDIRILRLPQQVASVEDTAVLELDFVANAR